MTRVDGLLLDTLETLGGIAPSKFALLIAADVSYRNGLRRIDILQRQGVLEIHHGQRGAHIIVRRKHV